MVRTLDHLAAPCRLAVPGRAWPCLAV